MLHIRGNDILRDGRKVGYFRLNKIFSADGANLGYFDNTHIYLPSRKKVGWVEGDRVKTMDGKNFQIEDINQQVDGSELTDAHRAAIHFSLGND